MEMPPTIPGTTETQQDTEPLMARLAALLKSSPARSQDSLQQGIEKLEDALANESNPKVKESIKDALACLRHGPDDEDMDEDESSTMHRQDE